MRKNEFKKEFQTAFRVIALDKNAMSGVARDAQKSAMALFFLAFPAVVNLILGSVTVSHFSYYHLQILLGQLVIAVIAIFLASFIAEKGFHGTASHMGFFRVIGYASLIGWLNILTYLFLLIGISGLSGMRGGISFVAGIWTLVVFYKALRHVHSLNEGNSILVMVASIIGILVIQGVFVRFFDFTGGFIF